jgi:paraquat-inducible protein B
VRIRIVIPWLLVLILLGCAAKDLRLKIRYNQIYGLDENSRVLLDQNQIGDVTRVFYDKDGRYIVQVKINENFTNAATEHSRFLIINDPQREGKKAIEVIQIRKNGEPLENGSVVEGSSRSSAMFGEMWQQFEKELDNIKEHLQKFLKDLERLPESNQVKELEKELKELAEAMQRAGKQTREKIQNEILPLIQEELERLKKRLEEFGREKEVEPLEDQLDELIKT